METLLLNETLKEILFELKEIKSLLKEIKRKNDSILLEPIDLNEVTSSLKSLTTYD